MTSSFREFPADARTLRVTWEDFERGSRVPLRFQLVNDAPDTVLHVRLEGAGWLSVAPVEAALAAGETQGVSVIADAGAGRASVQAGAAPVASVQLAWQRLGSGGPSAAGSGAVYVRLPIAVCPSCEKILDPSLADGASVPEMCPFCFERLRACPVCGAPNHWRARVCLADESHVVRDDPEWPCLGGGPAHEGARALRAATLSRRWSYPTAASSPGQALAWSAPAAAYGLVAAAAAEPGGLAFLHAFEARRGAPLWEPFPLSDPVYPERGGVAIAAGRIYAATVEGVVVAVDAIRGTRLWQSAAPGKAYAAVTPCGDGGPLLVCVATDSGGALCQLDSETGALRARTELAGLPDTAPAFHDGVALVHDDSGCLTAVQVGASEPLWRRDCGAPLDAAPVVCDGRVYSATEAGTVLCHDAADGTEVWHAASIGAAVTGTPACDGSLVYLPAADGLHLLSAATGRAVRRYGTRRPIRSAPILLSGTVFLGDTDGDIQSASAGKALEKLYETGGVGSQIVAAPALTDATLFVVATNGVLYALALA